MPAYQPRVPHPEPVLASITESAFRAHLFRTRVRDLAILPLVALVVSAVMLPGCLSGGQVDDGVTVIEIITQSGWIGIVPEPPTKAWMDNVSTDPDELVPCSPYEVVNGTLYAYAGSTVGPSDLLVIGSAFGYLPVTGGAQRAQVVSGSTYAVHALLEPERLLFRVSGDGIFSEVDESNFDRVSGIAGDPASYLRFSYNVTDPGSGLTFQWAESHQITVYHDLPLVEEPDLPDLCP